MYILIDQNGSLSLQDVENMKAFSVRAQSEDVDRSKLLAIAQPVENEHYWIDVAAVIELSERSTDLEWVEGFSRMLKKVEPYGYYDIKTQKVKAHFDYVK